MFSVEYAKSVAKDLKPLPKKIRERALEIVENVLASDPYQGKPLSGLYKGLYRFRVGDYRIVYSIEHEATDSNEIRSVNTYHTDRPSWANDNAPGVLCPNNGSVAV